MILFVVLDLKGTPNQYDPVFQYLKSHNGWAHYMSPGWFVDTEVTPNDLVDAIKPHLQEKDRVMVVKLESPYQGWLAERAWAWIDKHSQRTL